MLLNHLNGTTSQEVAGSNPVGRANFTKTFIFQRLFFLFKIYNSIILLNLKVAGLNTTKITKLESLQTQHYNDNEVVFLFFGYL